MINTGGAKVESQLVCNWSVLILHEFGDTLCNSNERAYTLVTYKFANNFRALLQKTRDKKSMLYVMTAYYPEFIETSSEKKYY
jgi:hypothetical protein